MLLSSILLGLSTVTAILFSGVVDSFCSDLSEIGDVVSVSSVDIKGVSCEIDPCISTIFPTGVSGVVDNGFGLKLVGFKTTGDCKQPSESVKKSFL